MGEDDPAFKDRIRRVLNQELDSAKAQDLLIPSVAWGYYPANAEGDDLVVWTDENRRAELQRFHFPRQNKEPWLCIADFFRPVESGDLDYAGFQLVTMGPTVSEAAAVLFVAARLGRWPVVGRRAQRRTWPPERGAQRTVRQARWGRATPRPVGPRPAHNSAESYGGAHRLWRPRLRAGEPCWWC